MNLIINSFWEESDYKDKWKVWWTYSECTRKIWVLWMYSSTSTEYFLSWVHEYWITYEYLKMCTRLQWVRVQEYIGPNPGMYRFRQTSCEFQLISTITEAFLKPNYILQLSYENFELRAVKKCLLLRKRFINCINRTQIKPTLVFSQYYNRHFSVQSTHKTQTRRLHVYENEKVNKTSIRWECSQRYAKTCKGAITTIILPLRPLIKKETATCLLRAATKPIQTDIIQRIEEETQKDPRVFNHSSWSIKAAWLQKEIGIPPIIPPMSNERAPWLEPPYK